jgi:hypothetical protein
MHLRKLGMRVQILKLVHLVHDSCGSPSLLPFKKNMRLMASPPPKVFLYFKLPKHFKKLQFFCWGGGVAVAAKRGKM